ncbi:MAG: anaerobic ribonucleoside-triphosphate reductase activating protein [Spirochaetales bacterium]|nr:anaerobic ribonucleoside-triphosphate reductase activating protein [Spirochaetales bacterium]
MKLGIIKTSLIDYPEHVSTVLFLSGCNLRCPYCHNPELARGLVPEDGLSLEEVRAFLKKRAGVLDGVVITGGEPTIHPWLQELIDMAVSFGLKVKLDTNGLRPDVLKKLNNLSFIAMDVKTSPCRYSQLLTDGLPPMNDMAEKINESIAYILSSGIPHQFRTTLAREIVDISDVREICRLIKGCMSYRLTPYVPGNTLQENFNGDTSPEYMNNIMEVCKTTGIPAVLA